MTVRHTASITFIRLSVRSSYQVFSLPSFVFAMAHAASSEPAPAYNCGDRGVRYCIVGYSYPECEYIRARR